MSYSPYCRDSHLFVSPLAMITGILVHHHRGPVGTWVSAGAARARQLPCKLSTLGLRAVALFSPLLLAQPASADVVYRGLTHTALGGAVVTAPAGSQILSVSNLGSSGQDGVSIALPQAVSWDAHWQALEPLDPAAALPPGAYVQSEILGTAGTAANGPLGSWRLTKVGPDNYAVTADFSPLGASTVTLEVYSGTTLVTTLTGQSGALTNINGCVDDDHWGHPTPSGPDGLPGRWGGALTFLSPRTFTFSGTASVQGDRLVILPEGGSAVSSLSAARLLASGIPEITIDSEHHSVQYAGLLHGSLGQAGLSVAERRLNVTNLGSSGQDGVEIKWPKPSGRKLNVYYLPPAPADNGTLSFTGFGATAAGAEQVISKTSITYSSDTSALAFDYSSIGSPTYTLRIYNGKTLVHESSGHPSGGSCLVRDRFPYRPLPLDDVHMGWYEDGPEYWNGTFWVSDPIWHPGYTCDTMPGGQTNRVIGGPEVFGDLVVGIPENPTATVVATSRFRIQGNGGISSLEIGAESLTSVHSTASALGQASLVPDGNNLIIGNLGSSGQDGVSLALDNVAGWAGHWQPLDPAGVLPVGAYLQSEIFGATAGGGAAGSPANVLLGSWKLTKADAGRYAVTADFSPLGASTVTLMVYNGAALVTTLTSQSGALANVNGCVDDDHWGNPTPPGPDGLPGRWGGALTFMGPTTFTFAGTASVQGDRLVILPEGGVAVSSLSETRLLASGIPQLTLDQERVFVRHAGLLHGSLGQARLSAAAGKLTVSNIGSSGQDGVEIDLGKPGTRKHNLYYRALGADGTLTFTGFGTVGTQADQATGSSSIGFSATEKTVAFDFSAIGASTYTLRIYNDGQLVHTSPGHTGPCVVADRYPYPLLPLDDFHMGEWLDTGKEDNLGIPILEWCPGYGYQTSQNTTSQRVIGGPTVQGNLVLAIPENPTLTVGSVARTKIQASGQITALEFGAESLSSPHSTASALGQAALAPDGDNLTVANLGSSGQDGVSLTLGNVAGWATHWQPLDPAGALPVGAYLQSEILGSAGSTGAGPLGSWRMTKAGAGNYAVTADFSPLGASTVTLLVYQGATLVTTLTGQSGALATVNGCVDDDHWGNPTPTGPNGIPGRWGGALTFRDPRTFAFGGSASVQGDRLVILPEGGTTVSSLSETRLLASGIPQLTLDEESISLPYAGLLHGSLGQAGLKAENGLLTAYNLGSSGQDGVEISLPPSNDRRLNLYYQVPLTDGTLSFTGLGSTNAQSEQVVGKTRIEYSGDTATVAFDYSSVGSPTYTLRIYNGKTLVHESGGYPSGSPCLVKDRFRYKKLPMDDVHMGWYEEGPEYWNGTFWVSDWIWHPGYTCDTWPGGQTNRVIGGPAVFGDLVIGIPENPTATVVAASRFKIQASGQIINFQIGSESLSSDPNSPMPYSVWANNVAVNGNITVAELGGPQDDYDHDGFNNLMEYAFGSDPLVSSSGPVMTSGISTLSVDGTMDEYLTLSCERPADRIMPVAQASDDLQSWLPAVLISRVTQPNGRVLDTWRYPVPRSARTRALMRYQVTLDE